MTRSHLQVRGVASRLHQTLWPLSDYYRDYPPDNALRLALWGQRSLLPPHGLGATNMSDSLPCRATEGRRGDGLNRAAGYRDMGGVRLHLLSIPDYKNELPRLLFREIV